jgi:hypothetical protein
MSRGKYLSLEEARKAKQLDRFAKEHPTEGDKKEFDDLLGRMARDEPTSKKPKRWSSEGSE